MNYIYSNNFFEQEVFWGKFTLIMRFGMTWRAPWANDAINVREFLWSARVAFVKEDAEVFEDSLAKVEKFLATYEALEAVKDGNAYLVREVL